MRLTVNSPPWSAEESDLVEGFRYDGGVGLCRVDDRGICRRWGSGSFQQSEFPFIQYSVNDVYKSPYYFFGAVGAGGVGVSLSTALANSFSGVPFIKVLAAV